MNIELINTGSELMLGRVLNTHQQWLCRQLADQGWVVTRQVAVDDNVEMIRQAVQEALTRADLIIATGGLGPTSDDRTRDVIATLLGLALQRDEATLRHIEKFFTARGRPMPPSAAVQALIPAGATVLKNAFGTAPGLVVRIAPGSEASSPLPAKSLLVMLPGPPRELRPMFSRQVLPLLREWLPPQPAYVCRTLRSTGIPESRMEETIAPALTALVSAGLDLGYCARPGEVDVRLAARDRAPEPAKIAPAATSTSPLKAQETLTQGNLPSSCALSAWEIVTQAEQIVRRRVGEALYGCEDDLIEEVVVRALTERGQRLTCAESCTGGLIAHRLTNVPGASQVFWGGWVTYANAAKEQLLGVRPETLAQHGAVSEPVAREMAEGARVRSQADYALAVTGIAGPSGGTPDKPVGTVFLALATPRQTIVRQSLNAFERDTFKHVTSQQALEMLRQELRAGHRP